MPKRKILIPLDGSNFSQQILPQVTKFFNPADTELILLRVAPEPQGLVAMPPQSVAVHWPRPMYQSPREAELAHHPIYASQIRESQAARLEDELRANLLNLRQAGYTVSSRIRFGRPASEILNAIIEEQVNLVAMTSHGRTGLKRLIFGSVAQEVLHKAPVPVLLLQSGVFQSDSWSLDQDKD